MVHVCVYLYECYIYIQTLVWMTLTHPKAVINLEPKNQECKMFY